MVERNWFSLQDILTAVAFTGWIVTDSGWAEGRGREGRDTENVFCEVHRPYGIRYAVSKPC